MHVNAINQGWEINPNVIIISIMASHKHKNTIIEENNKCIKRWSVGMKFPVLRMHVESVSTVYIFWSQSVTNWYSAHPEDNLSYLLIPQLEFIVKPITQ